MNKKIFLILIILMASKIFATEIFLVTVQNDSKHYISLSQSSIQTWDNTGGLPTDQLVILPNNHYTFQISDNNSRGSKDDTDDDAIRLLVQYPNVSGQLPVYKAIIMGFKNPGSTYAPWLAIAGDWKTHTANRVFSNNKFHYANFIVKDSTIEVHLDNDPTDNNRNYTLDIASALTPDILHPATINGRVLDILKTDKFVQAKLNTFAKGYENQWSYDESNNILYTVLPGYYKISNADNFNIEVHYEDIPGSLNKCMSSEHYSKQIPDKDLKTVVTNSKTVTKAQLKFKKLADTHPIFIQNTLDQVLADDIPNAVYANPGLFYNELGELYTNASFPGGSISAKPYNINYIPQVMLGNNSYAINNPDDQAITKEIFDADSTTYLKNQSPVTQSLTAGQVSVSYSQSTSVSHTSAQAFEYSQSGNIEFGLKVKVLEVKGGITIGFKQTFNTSDTNTQTITTTETKTLAPGAIIVPAYCMAVVHASMMQYDAQGKLYYYLQINDNTQFNLQNAYTPNMFKSKYLGSSNQPFWNKLFK